MPNITPPHAAVLLALVLAFAALAGAAAPEKTAPADELALVPWPRSVKPEAGRLELTDKGHVVASDKRLAPLAKILAGEVALATGLRLPVADGPARDGDVVLALDGAIKGEAYRLTVADRATVTAGGYNGAALGTATLLQALRADGAKVALPRLTVEDGPHFAYCGAMLDVARKPYSIATLKECVRVCRSYKIRYLHLHMTDENAWVFPSTAYPKLGSGNFAWAGGDKPAVYKLAELKELVAYADARGVTLVPEIEMPGHSGQLRGTLPEVFGYKDESGKAVGLGVINMVSDDAYKALDTLIGEACAVFRSSPYVHIGCDEASAAGIEKLPEVKAFVARNKLASAGDVFNAFVNRMHGIVTKHGKRMIVWEGAPLGPVAPPKDLVVMPWVGGSGAAAECVKRGYAVINAPWGTKEAYFDPYLVNGARLKQGEPLLLGATSILWQSPQKAAVPYLRSTGALRNEPAWNPDAKRGHADFLRRTRATDALLDRLLDGFTFRADGALDPLVFMRPDAAFDKEATLTLSAALKAGKVRYTLDGGAPAERSTAYGEPIKLRKTTTVKAHLFGAGGEELFTFARTYRKVPAVAHDAVGAAVTFTPEKPGYPGPGPKGLTDGLLADGDESGSAGWVGWERGAGAIQINVDLGKPKRVTTVGAHFLRAAGGVALPAKVEFAVSDDGKAFRTVATVAEKAGAAQRGWYTADVAAVTARHVRVSPAAGGDWTFLDEVVVNPKLPGPTFRHAALGKPVTLAHPAAPGYSAPGVGGLTDGYVARSPDFLNPEWLGVEGKNVDATIDLGKVTEVREVGGHFLQYVGAGVFIPATTDVLVSDDGKEFRKVATVKHEQDQRPAYTKVLSAKLEGVKARFVRVVAHTNGLWLFVDEVFVNPESDARPE